MKIEDKSNDSSVERQNFQARHFDIIIIIRESKKKSNQTKSKRRKNSIEKNGKSLRCYFYFTGTFRKFLL